MIIGISGKIGSGKNTVADYIKNKISGEVYDTAFAYKLKEMVSILFDIPYEDTLSQNGKNKTIDGFDLTIGEVLQLVGTDAMRDIIDDNIWVKLLDKNIKNKTKSYDHIIVTDLRFPNEYYYIKEQKGLTINVVRPNNYINLNSNRDVNHISEKALNDQVFDYTVVNDKDLKHLELQVDAILDDIFSIH